MGRSASTSTRVDPVNLARLLFSQGFGTRRECAALVAAGCVRIGAVVLRDPAHEVEPEGLVFEVNGVAWPWHERALIVLNKPAGFECSMRPGHHPGVLSLLPAPLQRRGMQPVGRLDADTTGLLLLTDDGALIHRLTSPKRHVTKVYEVGCKHPVDAAQAERLLEGVMLHDTEMPVRAAACAITGVNTLRLTLTEGRYHQVKRMVAAAGNRVERLHRSAFGALELPPDLAPGEWCWLSGPGIITPR